MTDTSNVLAMFARKPNTKSYFGASDLTEEKRLRFWLAPVRCEAGGFFHDKLTHSKNKHYLVTHPYSKQRIESCQVPESVMYSPEWFVKMKTPTSNSLQFSEAIQETKTKEGDLRIGGGGGNDVPLGRKTMSQGFYNQLRKRYTTSKHGVAKSSRAIAAKTVTESHRAGLVSSWQAIPSTCNATE